MMKSMCLWAFAWWTILLQMRESTGNLWQSLINDVLDVSRIESGRIVLTEEAFSLPEFVQRLFVPFERAEDERLKGIQGTGLGMVITKNILRMMIQPPVRALP